MKNVKKGLFILLSIMLLSMNFVSVNANSKRVIKVGIFNLGNFMRIDDKGDVSGYNIDYLEKIGEKNNWEFEYVKCENWVEATSLLENNEIDLLAPAQQTKSLVERFDFTAYEMGVEFGAVYCLNDRKDLIYEDFQGMSKLTFGGVEESSFTENFKIYAQENDFTPNIKTYNNTTELFNALNSKEVDCIVTNIMFATENVKTLGRFNPTPVYYICNKGNSSLIKEVNDALYQITLDDPTLQADLTSKYFPQYTNTQFSYNEYKFAKELGTINVGYVPNESPISFTNDKGEFDGISRKILDKISKKSGIKFNYIPVSKKNFNEKYLSEHKIYVLCGMENNHYNSINSSLLLSHTYLKSEMVMVGKDVKSISKNAKLKIAVSSNYETLEDVIHDSYPNYKVIKYNSNDDCFDAVVKGEVDMVLQNRYIAAPFLTNPKYSSLSVVPITSIANDLSLCVYKMKHEDDVLNDVESDKFISIINKSIDQISSEDINKIIIQETANNNYKTTMLDFLYFYRYYIILIILSIGAVFVLFVRKNKFEEDKNNELEEKNEQLNIAVEQAHQANIAKSQFLSRMSHEIRTPMNAIVGLTTIAKSHSHDYEKVEDYLSKIDSSSKILLNIINDVLDMSAIESNKLKIASNPFDFKELLSSISNVYYTQCKNKGILFEMFTEQLNEEVVVGDSLRVNQILLNLISNAYKFTDEGGEIKVEVKEVSRKDDLVFIQIKVSDTGCGMSKDMLSRLFKTFEQEDVNTAKKYGGSGLGMSITKNLVDLMGGDIKVTSVKDEGTKFTVELPFKLAENARKIKTEDIKHMRVLVCDDDAYALMHISTVLDRLHVQYVTANDGQKALDLIAESIEENKKFDVCFLDWKMPHMSGIDVTRKIREVYSKEMIIIIASAYDLSEVGDEAKEAGANIFVSKPLFQSTVFNTLLTITNGHLYDDKKDQDDFDFGGKKVLLVEDNEMNTEIAIELLDMVNIQVDHASNGKLAVDMFNGAKVGTYELILMDIQMPVMDGYEATKAIRALDREDAKDIPIYAMSADAFTEDVSKALNSGMNGHISKPIDTSVLYTTIDKEIKRKNNK